MKYAALNIIQPNGIPKTPANQDTLNTIMSDIFIVLGALALLMVVIGGLRYTFARGNADSTAEARRVIVYSIIGLVMAALAYSIVNVVLQRAG